jgi:hypothetical protein
VTKASPACAALLALALSACAGGAATSETAPVAGERPAQFVGRWESTTVSRGGLGAVMDLAEDGMMTGGIAVLVAGTWSLAGTRLSWNTADGGSAETDVTFAGDVMTVRAGAETAQHRRVGAATPGQPPIVGVWTYPHPAGGWGFERYGADRRMEFRLAMPGAAVGTWSANADTLTLESKDSRRTYDVRLAGDVLTLTADGQSTSYRRTDRWYDFPAKFKD